MMIQVLDLSPEEYFELWQHTVTMEHSCEKEMLMSICPWRVSATYPIGGRNFQRLTINTQTHMTRFLITLCINVSTNQFNLCLPQSLKWDQHWIPQGNLTRSIHMTYRGKMIHTTLKHRAYSTYKQSTLPKRGGQVKLVMWSNIVYLNLYNSSFSQWQGIS